VPNIIVLGGDGFCGWPAALCLSAKGYDVTIVDNLSRREIDIELEIESLTPIRPIGERINAWREITGNHIEFRNITLGRDYDELLQLFHEVEPVAVIHFAEQRAAPYSMKSPKHKRYTVSNNLRATHDVLCAIVESGQDIHLIHLGTMGVYGYTAVGSKIPEGYLDVHIDNAASHEPVEILHPTDPGSIYHMTKAQDQLFFQYYAKNDGVRITDLHQGIVWGTQTHETSLDPRLINRFDYDGNYGTVLNRFLMQAAIGYPLTVHGTGRQTRAFIHIRDSVRCIQFAVQNPPQKGSRVNIVNQVTETHRLIDLAKMISKLTGAKYQFVENPRNEATENELDVVNDQVISLGLKPTKLQSSLMEEVYNIAKRYAERCEEEKIPSQSVWRSDRHRQHLYRAEAKDLPSISSLDTPALSD
jgi:UDP-sulfoquinovose synthase